jgi:hypothetical protein
MPTGRDGADSRQAKSSRWAMEFKNPADAEQGFEGMRKAGCRSNYHLTMPTSGVGTSETNGIGWFKSAIRVTPDMAPPNGHVAG